MRKFPAITATLLVGASLALAGCGSRGADEVEWARAALARNPNVEIVSVDESKGVFTVKDRATGEVRTLRVDEIAAAPPPPAAPPAPAAVADAPAAADSTTPPTAGESAMVVEESVPATSEPDPVVSEADSPTPSATPTPTGSGKLVAAGPGYTITRAAGAAPARTEPAPTRAASSEPLRAEPIICQGQRFMRIDGRNIESSVDAIVAEDGCDLHITNANIRAGGIALVVRDARVHITNSTLTGAGASFEASGTAEVFAKGSTFAGITRRFDAAVVNDLGGNQFR